MKSLFGSVALYAVASMLGGVDAIEHPMLASTHYFRETWKEQPENDPLFLRKKEQRLARKVDTDRRPVIGVLTEPLRGDLYKGSE